MDLLILGIAVSPVPTDGELRFTQFCQVNNLPYQIIGSGEKWQGGDLEKGTGGAQKINVLRDVLKLLDNKLIIVTDTFDVFPVSNTTEILDKYHKYYHPKIVAAAEIYCWPDAQLKTSYVTNYKYKYLNSGCIMGYRDTIYDLIKDDVVADTDDDQLFYTLKYLAGNEIILDHDCHLFQALAGVTDDIEIHDKRVYNNHTQTYPVFLHGNGPAKLFINHLENYLRQVQHPKVFIAIYITSTCNLRLFLQHAANLDYPEKVYYIYDTTNQRDVIDEMFNHEYVYQVHSGAGYIFGDFLQNDSSHTLNRTGYDYYFLLEQKCILTNSNVIHKLLLEKRRIITPLLVDDKNDTYSNFWGDVDSNGYYSRSSNYLNIVKGIERGCWNVPYVTGAVLIDADVIRHWNITQQNQFEDFDMALCYNFRRFALFMYVVNKSYYGYLT